MEKELRKAIKKIMKYDFYDEHEKPIAPSIKGKNESDLKELFLKTVMDITFIKDDDGDLRIVHDDELQKLLGDEIVDLFERANETPQEFTEEQIEELKVMAKEVKEKQEEIKPIEEEPIVEEKPKKKKTTKKQELIEEPVETIEESEVFEEKSKRIRNLPNEDPFIRPSAVTKAIMILCESNDPDSISVDGLVKLLREDGFLMSETTARIQRGVAIKTISYLKRLGKLK